MKRPTYILLVSFAAFFLSSFHPGRESRHPRILIFCKTSGFHHESIPDGIRAITRMGMQHGFVCDTTTDSLQINKKNLKKYVAVIFLNTTGDVLGAEEQEAFEEYIRAGNGFVGIHAASDTEYGWPWYNQLVGAYFSSHPRQQQAVIELQNKAFNRMAGMPEKWSRWDEWYNFKDTHWDQVEVLLTLDETSIEGATNDGFHPVSWYHDFDGGRSFYTAMGHTREAYADRLFLQHLLGGIEYAMGKN